MAFSGKEADGKKLRRVKSDGDLSHTIPEPKVQGGKGSLPKNSEPKVRKEQAIAGASNLIQQSESAVRRDPNDPSIIYLGDPSKEKINWPTETDGKQIYSIAAGGSLHNTFSRNPELLEAFDKTDTEPSDEELMKQVRGFFKKWGEDYD